MPESSNRPPDNPAERKARYRKIFKRLPPKTQEVFLSLTEDQRKVIRDIMAVDPENFTSEMMLAEVKKLGLGKHELISSTRSDITAPVKLSKLHGDGTHSTDAETDVADKVEEFLDNLRMGFVEQTLRIRNELRGKFNLTKAEGYKEIFKAGFIRNVGLGFYAEAYRLYDEFGIGIVDLNRNPDISEVMEEALEKEKQTGNRLNISNLVLTFGDCFDFTKLKSYEDVIWQDMIAEARFPIGDQQSSALPPQAEPSAETPIDSDSAMLGRVAIPILEPEFGSPKSPHDTATMPAIDGRFFVGASGTITTPENHPSPSVTNLTPAPTDKVIIQPESADVTETAKQSLIKYLRIANTDALKLIFDEYIAGFQECRDAAKEGFLLAIREHRITDARIINELGVLDVKDDDYVKAIATGYTSALKEIRNKDALDLRSAFEGERIIDFDALHQEFYREVVVPIRLPSVRQKLITCLSEGDVAQTESLLSEYGLYGNFAEIVGYEVALRKGFLKALSEYRISDAKQIYDKFDPGIDLRHELKTAYLVCAKKGEIQILIDIYSNFSQEVIDFSHCDSAEDRQAISQIYLKAKKEGRNDDAICIRNLFSLFSSIDFGGLDKQFEREVVLEPKLALARQDLITYLSEGNISQIESILGQFGIHDNFMDIEGYDNAVKQGFFKALSERNVPLALKIYDELSPATDLRPELKKAYLAFAKTGETQVLRDIYVKFFREKIDFSACGSDENRQAVSQIYLTAKKEGRGGDVIGLRNLFRTVPGIDFDEIDKQFEREVVLPQKITAAKQNFLNSLSQGNIKEIEAVIKKYGIHDCFMNIEGYDAAVSQGFSRALSEGRLDDAEKIYDQFGPGIDLRPELKKLYLDCVKTGDIRTIREIYTIFSDDKVDFSDCDSAEDRQAVSQIYLTAKKEKRVDEAMDVRNLFRSFPAIDFDELDKQYYRQVVLPPELVSARQDFLTNMSQGNIAKVEDIVRDYGIHECFMDIKDVYIASVRQGFLTALLEDRFSDADKIYDQFGPGIDLTPELKKVYLDNLKKGKIWALKRIESKYSSEGLDFRDYPEDIYVQAIEQGYLTAKREGRDDDTLDIVHLSGTINISFGDLNKLFDEEKKESAALAGEPDAAIVAEEKPEALDEEEIKRRDDVIQKFTENITSGKIAEAIDIYDQEVGKINFYEIEPCRDAIKQAFWDVLSDGKSAIVLEIINRFPEVKLAKIEPAVRRGYLTAKREGREGDAGQLRIIFAYENIDFNSMDEVITKERKARLFRTDILGDALEAHITSMMKEDDPENFFVYFKHKNYEAAKEHLKTYGDKLGLRHTDRFEQMVRSSFSEFLVNGDFNNTQLIRNEFGLHMDLTKEMEYCLNKGLGEGDMEYCHQLLQHFPEIRNIAGYEQKVRKSFEGAIVNGNFQYAQFIRNEFGPNMDIYIYVENGITKSLDEGQNEHLELYLAHFPDETKQVYSNFLSKRYTFYAEKLQKVLRSKKVIDEVCHKAAYQGYLKYLEEGHLKEALDFRNKFDVEESKQSPEELKAAINKGFYQCLITGDFKTAKAFLKRGGNLIDTQNVLLRAYNDCIHLYPDKLEIATQISLKFGKLADFPK